VGMDFEWDENKRLSNLSKHGVDFEDVRFIFDGDTVTVEDDRYNYGEQRLVTFGFLRGSIISVTHTETHSEHGDVIRVISARKATKHEQQLYFEQV
jgi:uncharacterized protein